jgi:hypothetical protein
MVEKRMALYRWLNHCVNSSDTDISKWLIVKMVRIRLNVNDTEAIVKIENC